MNPEYADDAKLIYNTLDGTVYFIDGDVDIKVHEKAYNDAMEGLFGEHLFDEPKSVDEDSINPIHYTSFAIPPNEYITANNLEWEVGNVVKYVSRYHMKNGEEDLKKAIKYIELLIERKYGNGTDK